MLTISFATQYYTLWDVTSRIQYGRGEVINGVFTGESYLVTNYTYLQNLSFVKEDAIAKIKLMAGENEWNEDDSLRGKSRSWEARKKIDRNFAQWQFTFGMYIGTDIRECKDAWQLRRAMNQEPAPRTRVYARRRLIELGELVRYTWTSRVFNQALCDKWWKEEASKYENPYEVATHDMFCVDVIKNYTTQKHATILESKKQEALLSGHFSENGKRIDISIKKLRSFSFDSQYGTMFVVTYVTAKGNICKYIGGNPPEISSEEFTKVKATVKHDEYKGQKETKLQRIKTQVK